MELLNLIISKSADKNAPFCEHRIKGKNSPWITEEFLIAIRERDFLLKRASISKDLADWTVFKTKRNTTNKLKNSLKQSFYSNAFKESKDNPKDLWKKVKQLIPDQS